MPCFRSSSGLPETGPRGSPWPWVNANTAGIPDEEERCGTFEQLPMKRVTYSVCTTASSCSCISLLVVGCPWLVCLESLPMLEIDGDVPRDFSIPRRRGGWSECKNKDT